MTAVNAAPPTAQLRKYKLSIVQRIPMLAYKFLCLLIATCVGSAIYFLFTQVKWETGYGTKTTTLWYAKNMWDGLPMHFDNQFGVHWFGATNVIPNWWVTARHDTRHVMIGFIAALLIGAITIPIKNRKRVGYGHMALAVPEAFVAAVVTTAALIGLFNYVTPFIAHWGTTTNQPFVQHLIGKGTIQLTVIGLIAGLVAKTILKPTFDTIQLMSLERHLVQGDVEKWYWKFVYPPNYRNRYRYLQESDHKVDKVNTWFGFALVMAVPFFTFLLGVGVWLDYFGPAVHAA